MDVEFTNVIEMTLVAEESGNAFHSYTWIHYSIPKRVKGLTNITDRTLAAIGCDLNNSMTALVEFIHNEQLQSATDSVIIAHGGYLHDFPILLANCMKYNFNDFGILNDSLHTFKDLA